MCTQVKQVEYEEKIMIDKWKRFVHNWERNKIVKIFKNNKITSFYSTFYYSYYCSQSIHFRRNYLCWFVYCRKAELGSVRPVLWLLLVAAHLAELGDAALRVSHGHGHRGTCWPLLSPCLALVAATCLQLICPPPFLAAALYAAVGGARVYVLLRLLDEGLDFQHVRLGATGAAAACAATLALYYLLQVAYFQVSIALMDSWPRSGKIFKADLTSKESCLYSLIVVGKWAEAKKVNYNSWLLWKTFLSNLIII